MSSESIRAWWFAPNNERRLEYRDGRIARVGVTHSVKGRPKLCSHGLHASIRPVDALRYAYSSKLYLVELSGDVVHGDDKVVATERTYIEYYDCDKLLCVFARRCALINIEKVKPYCSSADYEIILNFLKTGKGREAAGSAAKSAAWSAAESAAREEQNTILLELLSEKFKKIGDKQ